MKKVLITGATGATGGNAIKKLLELKVSVRALVHKVDERSEKLSSQGVEIVRGDLSDFEAVSAALQEITAAYFVYPVKVPGILEATAFFAQAALEQGVGAIVNMSQISARRIAKVTLPRIIGLPSVFWIAQEFQSLICDPPSLPNGSRIYRKASGRKIYSHFPLATPAMHPSRRKIRAGSLPRS